MFEFHGMQWLGCVQGRGLLCFHAQLFAGEKLGLSIRIKREEQQGAGAAAASGCIESVFIAEGGKELVDHPYFYMAGI
jgi:hypothetical protein